MQVRSPGQEDPLEEEKDSCQDDPMDKGAWWATAHEVTESQT